MTASTLQCRLLCACGCAYGIENSADVVEDDAKLDAVRILEIDGKLVELDVEAIGAAHCSGCPGTGCAGGYMGGACPGEVCGASEQLSGTVTPAG
jgi:hypothetical protein